MCEMSWDMYAYMWLYAQEIWIQIGRVLNMLLLSIRCMRCVCVCTVQTPNFTVKRGKYLS